MGSRISNQNGGVGMECKHPKDRWILHDGVKVECDGCNKELALELFNRANVLALNGKGSEAGILHLAAGIIGKWAK